MENVAVATGQIVSVPAGKITVDEISESIKGGKQAQIRQEYTKSYPSKRISSTMQDSLFSADELGVVNTDYNDIRVAWIPVGDKHKVKDVQNALDKAPNACIYKVLSFKPILDDGQISALNNGLTNEAFENFISTNEDKYPQLEGKEMWDADCSTVLLEIIANSQIVRYGESNDAGKDADEPVLLNGKMQYRQTYFSLEARADVDRRNVVEKQSIPDMVLATQNVSEEVEA